MSKIILASHVITLCLFILSGCYAQTKDEQTNKETEPNKYPVIERKVVVVDNCWEEFKDLTANISVNFCCSPQKDVLDVTFKDTSIKRNSYLVLDSDANGNARYFLGWFDWKLKNEDENSVQKLYDEYTEDILKEDPRGSIKETREITLNGKIGRETTFAADNSNSLTIQIFYVKGKIVYAAFLPDELTKNKPLQDKSRNIFFGSFKILN